MKMKNLEEIKKQISEMDVKSEEFWSLYMLVADKYWTIENPDDYQTACKVVLGWLDRSVNKWEEQVVAASIIISEMFKMKNDGKSKSCTGTIGFSSENYTFDIYTTEVEKDKLSSELRKIAKGKASFGKNYFNKKQESK